MKIVDAQIQTERTSLKRPFKTAVRTAFDIQSLIVKITLENGITGYGSGVATEKVTGDSLSGMKNILEQLQLKRILVVLSIILLYSFNLWSKVIQNIIQF